MNIDNGKNIKVEKHHCRSSEENQAQGNQNSRSKAKKIYKSQPKQTLTSRNTEDKIANSKIIGSPIDSRHKEI